MRQIYTLKLKLFLSQKDKGLLEKTISVYRKACNFVSVYVFKTGIDDRKSLNDQLYCVVRHRFNLGAQMTQSIFRQVLGEYKTIKSQRNDRKIPVFISGRCDEVYGRDYYFLQNGKVSIGLCKGRLKPSFSKKGFEKYFSKEYRFGTAQILRDRKNNYYLSTSVSKEVSDAKLLPSNSIFVGIDRGIRYVMVAHSSDGNTLFYQGGSIEKRREQFEKIRKDLKKRNTPSSRRRLKAIGSRENRYIRNENHVVSKALLNSFPCGTTFILEGLSGLSKNINKFSFQPLKRALVSWSYYDLEQKLVYKARDKQDPIVYVPPKNTSITCPKCGFVDYHNRNRPNHVFICKRCGFSANDDEVAATNILNLGIAKAKNDRVQSVNSVPTTPRCNAV